MKPEYLLLCIYPLILLGVMLIKMKVAPKGEFHEDFLSLKQSKIMQGVAAVGIIIHHLTQHITQYGMEYKGPISYFIFAGIFFTSIFFFCSGFGLMTSLQKKPNYLDTFLKKRLSAVLIPFLVSNVLYTVGVGLYFGTVVSVTEMIKCLVGVRLINTNTWFLVEIAILYLAFYFIFRFIKKTDKAMMAMSIFVVALILFSLLLGHDTSEAGGHWFMGEWWYNTTIFFLAGMFMARYYDKVVAFFKKHYRWLLPVSIVLFIALFYGQMIVLSFFGYYQEWEGHPGYGAKLITLLYQNLSCVVWLGMVLLLSMKIKIQNVILYTIGEISLALYIVHELVKVFVTYSEYVSDVQIFLWVLVASFGFALAIHALNSFLIQLFLAEERPVDEEYMTPELRDRLREKKIKKKKIVVSLIVSVVIIAILGIGELYIRYVRPILYYKDEMEVLATAEIGDEVFFGTMETDYVKAGLERMQWYVADRQGDKLLLVSAEVLDGSYFHNKIDEPNYWEQSALRVYLNQLYTDSTSKYEKELVLLTTVETEDNPKYGTESGPATQDYMFILSAEEAELYFATDEERRMKPTPSAAMDHKVNINISSGYNYEKRDGYSWWWVRTAGADERKIAFVNAEGMIEYEGRYCTISSGGVRPAMWVTYATEKEWWEILRE